MLSLKTGLWESKSGTISGNFTVFGKEFVIFVNKNETQTGNQPEYYLTIQESNKNGTK
jgi:hypothetical protein